MKSKSSKKAPPSASAEESAGPAGPARAPGKPQRRSGHVITEEELAQLQQNLREAQETLDAIQNGDVDAVIVKGINGDQVYSLAGAEQPYRVYIEHMQEGAVTVSPDGVILYCNRRFAEMIDKPLERVLGSRITEQLPAEAWSRLATLFSAVDSVVKHETVLSTAEISRHVLLTASCLQLDIGPLMCLVVTDLTLQRDKEKMRVAKELAEKANVARDGFIAALSHELRTPLTPALMAASILEKDSSLPEAARSDIGLIRRNIELEARLIDDLLDLTLITHGKLTLDQGVINLHSILNRSIESCQVAARQKRLNLKIDLEAKQPHAVGDAVRIQQVFTSVLRNAVKFTAVGGDISISTGQAPGHVWVRFADTGIGFEPEAATRIFRTFEQADRSVTRNYGGLGLGLPISRAIMEAHGGSIRAESPGRGKGAVFTLEFPLPNPRTAPPLSTERPRAQGMRILLVEDHRDTRVCIQQVLELARHQVTSAHSAEAALELAANDTFDLVISDLGLPDMSGHDLMRRLRSRYGLSGIALSGYGMKLDVERSHEAGFTHHLTKPVSFDRLHALVAEFGRSRK